MYTVSDAVEMGNAQELILTLYKDEFVEDDFEPCSQLAERYFDE